MRPMACVVAWSALPIVVILAALPTDAFAQSLVCHAIRRGESATQVARRVTGDARNTYQASFQIMDLSSRFIPKSQYNRIRAGWRACVVQTATPDPSPVEVAAVRAAPVAPAAPAAVVAAAAVEVAGDNAPPAASHVLPAIGSVDLTMVWLGAAMVLPWFGWRILDDYLVRRKTKTIVMRHFAIRFVEEFERPLVRNRVAERAVRSRLRTSVRRGRCDIFLAPAQGRRYPNMSDHRKNVEYDVTRVMKVLADDSFVSGRVYTHAEWIVVPIQFKAGPKQSGVTCISSL